MEHYCLQTMRVLLLPLLLSISTTFVASSSSSSSSIPPRPLELGIRVSLRHVDSSMSGNFTKLQLLQRASLRSKHRYSRLSATSPSSSEFGSPVHAGAGEYLMDLAIGTPSSPFSAILDTGSDLIWTQCFPCSRCFSQPDKIFSPSNSTTYSPLPCSSTSCQSLPTFSCTLSESEVAACDYLYSYGDSSSTQGALATETFTLGGEGSKGAGRMVSVPGVSFGCGDDNQGAGFSQGSGIVGLGRGPLSLVSQLGFGRFSYCLTSIDGDSTTSSTLFFGSTIAGGDGQLRWTPMVKSEYHPSFYFVSLKGITVGKTRLRIPSSTFELKADGSGGMIVDSGTSITYLEGGGYREVRRAFLSQMKLPAADGSATGLDLCFSTPAGASSTEEVEVPKLVLHFDGAGADMELLGKNYMVLDEDTGLLCLTVMGSEEGGMSILGNFQQQGMRFVYDVEGERIGFAPANCDTL